MMPFSHLLSLKSHIFSAEVSKRVMINTVVVGGVIFIDFVDSTKKNNRARELIQTLHYSPFFAHQ